jgi:hypothetical protein
MRHHRHLWPTNRSTIAGRDWAGGPGRRTSPDGDRPFHRAAGNRIARLEVFVVTHPLQEQVDYEYPRQESHNLAKTLEIQQNEK